MAITVNLYYSGEKDNARKFAEEMTALRLVNQIRAEKGNLKYEYFIPMDDENTILLIDSWKDQQSLDAHHSSPMMQKISELRLKYKLTVRAERYVSDSDGFTDNDKKFI